MRFALSGYGNVTEGLRSAMGWQSRQLWLGSCRLANVRNGSKADTRAQKKVLSYSRPAVLGSLQFATTSMRQRL